MPRRRTRASAAAEPAPAHKRTFTIHSPTAEQLQITIHDTRVAEVFTLFHLVAREISNAPDSFVLEYNLPDGSLVQLLSTQTSTLDDLGVPAMLRLNRTVAQELEVARRIQAGDEAVRELRRAPWSRQKVRARAPAAAPAPSEEDGGLARASLAAGLLLVGAVVMWAF